MSVVPEPRIYTSAFFCVEVLREGQSNLFSAIRIVDSVEAGELPLPDGLTAPIPVSIYFVATFNSEFAVKFTPRLRVLAPDGSELDGKFVPSQCAIEGGIGGHTMSFAMSLPGHLQGMFWFEVYTDNDLAIRLPLMVTHKNSTRIPRSGEACEPDT